MYQRILMLFFLLSSSSSWSLLSEAQLLGAGSASTSGAARIQCEYRDKDGDSLILNCTLVTGLMPPGLDSSVVAGVLVNSLEQQPGGGQQAGGGGGSSTAHLNIRVGMDRHWRTPWESLSINHNIIRTLIWRNSRLADIGPYAFKDLASVQRLDLSHNRLVDLNSSALGQLEVDLLDLDLSHNLFSQIPWELFEANKRASQALETLRMNENPISVVTRRPLQAVRASLRLIELNYCQIRAIEPDAFEGMRQLESISLVGNHLRHLSQATFADLTLRSFYVHENPLVCDCHMRWLIDYLKTVDYQQQTYESQLSIQSTTSGRQSGGVGSSSILEPGLSMQQRQQQPGGGGGQQQAFTYVGGMSVAGAAQTLLKCDQPNSLKSKPNFLDINPDSFMCDIQLAFRDHVNESTYELGEDAVLLCDVYGDPEPDIYWSFGQRPIEKALSNELDKYYVTEMRMNAGGGGASAAAAKAGHHQGYPGGGGGKYMSNKTSELRIRDLQPSDMGFYTCTAEIKGSNNRKQIVFAVRQIKGPATSLSNAGDYFLNGVYSLMTQLANSLYQALGGGGGGGQHASMSLPSGARSTLPPVMSHASSNSSSTFVLLFSILVSLFVFLCVVCAFICWRVNCCCCCGGGRSRKRHHRRLSKTSEKLMSVDDLMRREQEKLLISGPTMTIGRDHTDHHHHHHNQNYANLVNDSSATLVSNTKASNSIRMAYPNYHHASTVAAQPPLMPPPHHLLHAQHPHHLLNNNNNNDIYANHSLLTTTSSATAVSSSIYPPPPPPPPPPGAAHQAIAIDTSNQTPRYHLLQQQQQQDCYYDDLRYNGDEPATSRVSPSMNPSAIYSSPYRHHSHQHGNSSSQQSYSPLIRRDDPTVPLYATLKPKLLMQAQQQAAAAAAAAQIQIQASSAAAAAASRSYNNYVQYSTIHRSQPATAMPITKPRSGNYQHVGGVGGVGGGASGVMTMQHHHQHHLLHQLPPPPPPPPAAVPPLKPKRTFEYVMMGNRADLHSESGAFLLDEAATVNTTPSINMTENELIEKSRPKLKSKKKTKHYQQHQQQQRAHGSTTSLDEEDLDLNDLKDFEDVTFDNLRKPGEDTVNHNKPTTTTMRGLAEKTPIRTTTMATTKSATPSESPKPAEVASKFKSALVNGIRMQDLKMQPDTNSEQSLLLKSSSSSESKCSSENTINNICNGGGGGGGVASGGVGGGGGCSGGGASVGGTSSNSTNTTSAANTSSELRSSSDLNRGSGGGGSGGEVESGSGSSNVLVVDSSSASSSSTPTIPQNSGGGGKAEGGNLMENVVVDEMNSKIYEETEI